jgi:hypothetical protein
MIHIWQITCTKKGVLRTVIFYVRNWTRVNLSGANVVSEASRPCRVEHVSAPIERYFDQGEIGDSAFRLCAVKGM